MACNVFGVPITVETMNGTLNDKMNSEKRAADALIRKNEGGKDIKARNYVLGLKKDWDEYVEKVKNDNVENKTCCLVLIYNATGDTLKYVTSHDFENADKKAIGNIGRSPYPSRIENGQWGAFLHVQTLGTTIGCKAAVVYRGTINFKDFEDRPERKLDWMLGWHNPGLSGSYNTTIYGEVRAPDYFHGDEIWKGISDNMKAIHCHDEPARGKQGFGGAFDGTTGRGVASTYEAILKLGKEAE